VTAPDPVTARWWDGPRALALRQRWRGRLDRFSAPEVLAGALIVVTWALLATVTAGWWPIIAVAVGIGLWLHLAAVETGSHLMMWMTTGLVLGFIIVADAGFFGGLDAVSYSAAGVSALVHNELIRLNHARRRRAVIAERIYHLVAAGIALIAVITVVTVAAATALAGGGERSWWWMPVAIMVLLGTAGALAVAPARNAPPTSRHRWRPGDRIPPQPLGRSELPPEPPAGGPQRLIPSDPPDR
jgi:hypothetical protein